MNSYSDNSKIEFFRQRRHGIASRFRFLTDSQDGYLIQAELTTHFFVNRLWDTQMGARVEKLVFDKQPDFDIASIGGALFGDLVNPDLTYKRYRISLDAEPTALEVRYRFNVTGVFDDKTPIFGIAGDIPPDETSEFTTPNYIFRQTSPASVWTINHNLGFRPTISVYSDGGAIMIVDAAHVSNNQAIIYFSTPTTGEARCT